MEYEHTDEFLRRGVTPGETLRALSAQSGFQFRKIALTVQLPDAEHSCLDMRMVVWWQTSTQRRITRVSLIFSPICASATHLPLREAVLRDDAGNLLNACGQIARQFRPSTVQTSERITLGAGVVLCIE